MKSILNNRKFISKLDNARSNWINMSIDNVVNRLWFARKYSSIIKKIYLVI